jgi:hypothetical protein
MASHDQVASDHEPVAPVIPLSAKNYKPFIPQGSEAALHLKDHAAARIFHEDQAGDSIPFRSQPVYFSHLGCGENFHGFLL